MADPMTMAAVGAGAGALLDKKDPLRGAAMGGLGGFGAASLPGLAGAAAGTPAAAGGLAGQAAGAGYIDALGGTLGAELAGAPTLAAAAPAGYIDALGGTFDAGMAGVPTNTISLGSQLKYGATKAGDMIAANPLNIGMQGMKMMNQQTPMQQQMAPQMAAPQLRQPDTGPAPSFAQFAPQAPGFMTTNSQKKRMQGLLNGA